MNRPVILTPTGYLPDAGRLREFMRLTEPDYGIRFSPNHRLLGFQF
jgi:hypothetical protein